MPTPVTLDSIRDRLRKGGLSAAALAELVEQASKISTAAAERLRTRAAALDGNPLASSAERAKDRDAASLARLEAEDADAVLAAAQRAHAEAAAAEENGRRDTLYQAGKEASVTAAAMLVKEYPKATRTILGILGQLACAQRTVAAANAELPAGAEPIADPEMMARGVPGTRREIVSEEVVELWSRMDLIEPVDAAFQSEIYNCERGWGKRGDYDGGSASLGEAAALYRLRRYRKITTREPIDATYPMPLAAALQLPSLHTDLMLWGENFPVGVTPAMSRLVSGAAEPDAVLASLAEIEAAAIAKPAKIEPQIRVAFELIGDVVPLPAERPVDPQRSNPIQARSSKFGASPFAPTRAAGGRR